MNFHVKDFPHKLLKSMSSDEIKEFVFSQHKYLTKIFIEDEKEA